MVCVCGAYTRPFGLCPLLNWHLPFSAGAIEWVHAVAKGCVFGVILVLRGLACHIDSQWVQSSGSTRGHHTALLGSLLYSVAWRATSTGPVRSPVFGLECQVAWSATVTGCVTCGVAWWCHAGLECQYRCVSVAGSGVCCGVDVSIGFSGRSCLRVAAPAIADGFFGPWFSTHWPGYSVSEDACISSVLLLAH